MSEGAWGAPVAEGILTVEALEIKKMSSLVTSRVPMCLYCAAVMVSQELAEWVLTS